MPIYKVIKKKERYKLKEKKVSRGSRDGLWGCGIQSAVYLKAIQPRWPLSISVVS